MELPNERAKFGATVVAHCRIMQRFVSFSANNQSTTIYMHLSNVPATEDTYPSNLLMIWKEITYALISRLDMELCFTMN